MPVGGLCSGLSAARFGTRTHDLWDFATRQRPRNEACWISRNRGGLRLPEPRQPPFEKFTSAHFALPLNAGVNLFDDVPSSIEKVYSTLRQRTAGALRNNLWLAAAATVAGLAVLAAAIVLQSHWLVVIAAIAGVVVTAFVWGYTTRAFRVPPWPTLGHLHRRQYAETWDTMVSSSRTARIAVSGKAWEWELHDSTREPVRNLIELASIGVKDDVLEIACGIARLGLELVPLCHSWTGADISANMLAHAAERVKGVGNVKLHQLHGDGLAGLADDSFDVVYCTN